MGVDDFGCTFATTLDLSDLLICLRLHNLDGRSYFFGFLLHLLGLGLLHGDLGLDQ